MVRRDPKPGDQRALAVMARDAALARIGRARFLMLLMAVVLTSVLAALASALLPGKSLGASGKAPAPSGKRAVFGAGAHRPAPRRPTRSLHAAVPGMPAPASAAALGLQGPDQAPTAVAPQTSPAPQPAAPAPPAQPAPAPVAPAPVAPSGGGVVVSGGS